MSYQNYKIIQFKSEEEKICKIVEHCVKENST